MMDWRAAGWVLLLAAFAPVAWGQSGGGSGVVEATGNQDTRPPVSIYDPDPNHLWNRNQMMTPAVEFSTPSRSASIEPVARWKESYGKLDLLRAMMLGR